YGATQERQMLSADIEEITAPIEFLREIHIVDTPGTNALERRHEAITTEFIPRSDLVLFLTSADRPLSESERGFIETIRQWGKKIVMVINKVDILRHDAEIDALEKFVVENAGRILGAAPVVFAISARQALGGKEKKDSDLLDRSRLPELEAYLTETLDEAERIRLKLLNPLGVAGRLAANQREVVNSRRELLSADFDALEDIEEQLALYREDLSREFRFRLADVDNILLELEQQGQQFFEDTLRLPRVFDIINKSKVKAEFARRVVGNLGSRIEAKVDEIIDWMVASELRQWKAVTERLERRRTEHGDRVIGTIGAFDYDRKRLLDTVGRAAQRAIEHYDHDAEASRLAASVQNAVAGTAIIEVGAIGLGTMITAIASTQVADMTGILAASTIAVLGLFVLPARRRAAKRELERKVAVLRERLMVSLTETFDREVDKSQHRIEEAIAPYSRFVRGERERLADAAKDLGALSDRLERLRAEVESLS
ncbi:MAG TPA: dynamin family protein, partial [Thermoanaerobaculia bacterium]|nr:dynamin family protein [Thermoanaerobaculia bacterium]